MKVVFFIYKCWVVFGVYNECLYFVVFRVLVDFCKDFGVFVFFEKDIVCYWSFVRCCFYNCWGGDYNLFFCWVCVFVDLRYWCFYGIGF